MFRKLNFYVFSTKPNLNDSLCNEYKGIRKNGGALWK